MKAKQFIQIRILIGLYLALDFLLIAIDSDLLLSSNGLISNYSLYPDLLFSFSIFNAFDSYYYRISLLIVGILSALSLSFGSFRKASALLTWVIYAGFFSFTPMARITPAPEYMGILLILIGFAPGKEKTEKDWRLPTSFFFTVSFIFAFTYFASGIQKLFSIPWRKGESLFYILNSPQARDTFITDLALQFPSILTFLTFFTLVIEIGAPLLYLHKKSRAYAWLLLTSIHFFIIFMIDIQTITIGMLIFHYFCYSSKYAEQIFLDYKHLKLKLNFSN